jgi:hypothetical protein
MCPSVAIEESLVAKEESLVVLELDVVVLPVAMHGVVLEHVGLRITEYTIKSWQTGLEHRESLILQILMLY